VITVLCSKDHDGGGKGGSGGVGGKGGGRGK